MSDIVAFKSKASADAASYIDSSLAQANAFEVTDDKTMGMAELALKQLKSNRALIEDELAEFVEPAKAIIASAQARYSPIIKMAQRIEDIVKAKCVHFKMSLSAKKELARSEAQRLITVQAPVAEQRLAIAAVAAIEAPKTQSVTYVDHWVWFTTSASQVPAEYMITVVDGDKVAAAVAKGVRSIPGIVIENKPIMRVGRK